MKILKFDTYIKELSEYKEGKIKIIYRDDKLTIVVPSSFNASRITCRGTRWCTQSKFGYESFSRNFVLFRILFKDGYKLRLSWKKDGSEFTWGSGGDKYTEVGGYKNPFNLSKIIDEIEGDYEMIKNSERYKNKHYYDIEHYKKMDRMNEYEELSDEEKKVTNKEFYDDWYNVKKEIINRINMIPKEARTNIIKSMKN